MATGHPLPPATPEELATVEVAITVVAHRWQEMNPTVDRLSWGVQGAKMSLSITEENALQLVVDAFTAIRKFRRSQKEPAGYAPILGVLVQRLIAAERKEKENSTTTKLREPPPGA